MPGAAGPIGRRSHMPAGRRRGCRSSLHPSLPPSILLLRPSLPPSLLPWPGWRWERPRSHHEHPQGLQHVGDRLPGDQIPTERGNPNPGRQEHQVRAGGHLPGQRSPGGDEGQGRQPQSHPAPDRQRGPVLRGLRALRGSCGAKHSAGVPQVGLSPASPPSPDSTCIPERPHLPPPSPVSAVLAPPPASQPRETPSTKTPHCSCLRVPPADPGLVSEGSKESAARRSGCEQSWAWLTAASSASVNSKASGAV